jgi:Tol biopolymer transport system component
MIFATGRWLILAAFIGQVAMSTGMSRPCCKAGPALAPDSALTGVPLAVGSRSPLGATGRTRSSNSAVAAAPKSRLFLPYAARLEEVGKRRLTKSARRDWKPAFAPDGETIVYVSDDLAAGTSSLRLVPVDGSGSRPVPVAGVNDFGRPSFTPDGKAILFTTQATGAVTDTDIYSVRLDGTGLVNLTQSPQIAEYRPSIAPDGTWLVYDAVVGGNQDLYRLEMATGRRTRLTEDPAPDLLGTVSPDGRSIVFRSERDGNAEIYRMNADGTGVERLTDHPATDSYASDLFGQGAIVFQSDRGGHNDVFRMAADGNYVRRLSDGTEPCLMPAPSPDGQLIAVACDDATGNRDIYVLPVDGRAAAPPLLLAEAGQVVSSGRRIRPIWMVIAPAVPD